MDVSKPLKSGLSSARRFSQRHASAHLTKHGRPLARRLRTNICQTQRPPICTQQEHASAIADQAAGQLYSLFKIWQMGKIWGIAQSREKDLTDQNAQIETPDC
jgi:hypothetical protein